MVPVSLAATSRVLPFPFWASRKPGRLTGAMDDFLSMDVDLQFAPGAEFLPIPGALLVLRSRLTEDLVVSSRCRWSHIGGTCGKHLGNMRFV